jgi:hypothetical protein
VEILGDVREFGGSEVGKCGHAFVGKAFGNGETDQLAFLVVEYQGGADEVGCGRAASLFPMAEGAIGSEELFAPGSSGGVGWGP